MKKAVLGTLLAAGVIGVPAQASTVVVAQANSINGGAALVFGAVVGGQSLTVSSSTDDLWSAGGLPRYSDANGLTGVRLATATDDSGQLIGTQIGADFGTFSFAGYDSPYGALVGRIGGVYQFLGANYNGTAWNTGNLELFYWDSNNGDNFGEITFNITAGAGVPEPSIWALAILGFGVVGGALRRQRKARVALTFA